MSDNEKLIRKINKVVKKHWGFDTLKDKQMEIVTNYIKKKDVIGLLPTGYGKSMCYLVPPLVKKKVIFIISPLISLMEDQKEKLVEMNIPVAALHGNNFNKDKEIFQIIDGEINIVYLSPEFLIHGDGMELADTLIKDKMLGYLAIDESHCISVWGHDFRNSYLKIKKFRQKYPKIPILAVTATATFKVVQEIAENLLLKEPILVRANFDRPNLYLKCVNVKNTNLDVISPWLKKYRHSKIIIYTNSRRECVEISDQLNQKYGDKKNKLSLAYHAGMSKGMRNKIQSQFSNGDINIIVSTVAFGMGIDQIVRCVLIFGAPSSIEEYYQQIGRAGRDKKPAETILFFQYKNIVVGKHIYDVKNKSNDQDDDGDNYKIPSHIIKNKKKSLDIMAKYFYLSTCRRRFILEYFGQVPKFFCCNNCDNCCEKELINITDKIKKIMFENKSIKKIFSDSEIENLENASLVKKFNNKIVPTETLHNWKKLLTINKKIKNTPEKYMIKI